VHIEEIGTLEVIRSELINVSVSQGRPYLWRCHWGVKSHTFPKWTSSKTTSLG
jgi:hypothetical protein